MRKKKRFQPWLTPTGVEIQTAELREIAKSWDLATWEAYLKWYQSGGHERLIQPDIYNKICDEQTESLLAQISPGASQEFKAKCERLLADLPSIEAIVLRRYFIEGKTEAEIAFELKRSRCGIGKIKHRALSRLKRGNAGDEVAACQSMRGESSSLPAEEPSIWDEPLEHPLKENRIYDPDNHRAEFEQIKTHSVRAALLALTDTAQKILYLRHWCDFSVSQIARRLNRGVNVVEQIDSASVSKVKRAALEFELGITLGGDECF